MGGGFGLSDLKSMPDDAPRSRTVVLVGRTGNGKSATGNSILGRKSFKSTLSSAAVTQSCNMQTRVFKDGSVLNVIDTPGLFDFSDGGSEFIGEEIVKCIDFAKDGIHAVLLVFSVRTRFSQEEEATLRSLQAIFGSNLINYMIIVFTGGDDIDDMNVTLDDYLGRECPAPLRDIIELCENRVVLFNNKTDCNYKKASQLQQLSTLLNIVIARNGGIPYTDKLFSLRGGAIRLRDNVMKLDVLPGHSQEEIDELKAEMQKTYEDQLRAMTQMIESQLKDATEMFENQLSEEKAARARAEEIALESERKGSETISRMQKELEDSIKVLEKKLSKEEAARAKTEEAARKANENANAVMGNMKIDLENARREILIMCNSLGIYQK